MPLPGWWLADLSLPQQHHQLPSEHFHLNSPLWYWTPPGFFPCALISENASLQELKKAIRNAWDTSLILQVSQQWPPSHCPFRRASWWHNSVLDILRGWSNVAWHWHKLFIHKYSQKSKTYWVYASPGNFPDKTENKTQVMFPWGLLLVWCPGLKDSSRRPGEAFKTVVQVRNPPANAGGMGLIPDPGRSRRPQGN